jgi:hypothetical protein
MLHIIQFISGSHHFLINWVIQNSSTVIEGTTLVESPWINGHEQYNQKTRKNTLNKHGIHGSYTWPLNPSMVSHEILPVAFDAAWIGLSARWPAQQQRHLATSGLRRVIFVPPV